MAKNVVVNCGIRYETFPSNMGVLVVGVENKQQERVNIPAFLGEMPVFGIAAHVFENMESLTCVYIEHSPNAFHIGQSAFKNCKNLNYFQCKAATTCFMSEAFKGCSALTCISTQYARLIGTNIFEGCSYNLNLCSHFEEISDFAFQNSPFVKTVFFAPDVMLSANALYGIDAELFCFDGSAKFKVDATTQIQIDITIKCPSNSNLTELISYGYKLETF